MGARALPPARARGPADRGPTTGSARVFVVLRGRLHPLPEGFQLLAPTRLGPFLGLVALLVARQAPDGAATSCCRAAATPDESLGAFVRRRLGREALERVAQPLVGGIYTADPDELSLGRHHAALPRDGAARAQRDPRAVAGRAPGAGAPARARAARAGRSSSRFAEGMEELVRAAGRPAARGRGAPQGAGGRDRARAADGWRVTTAGGGVFAARRASSSSPEAHQAARLVRYVDPALAHLLEGIPVRLLRDGDARLSPRRHPPSARRLRLRGAAGRARGPSSRAPSRA